MSGANVNGSDRTLIPGANSSAITLGAAFDFLAGTKRQAPLWMQKRGLEWLFRLCTEPRRLWRRYAYIVPGFMILAIGDLTRRALNGSITRRRRTT